MFDKSIHNFINLFRKPNSQKYAKHPETCTLLQNYIKITISLKYPEEKISETSSSATKEIVFIKFYINNLTFLDYLYVIIVCTKLHILKKFPLIACFRTPCSTFLHVNMILLTIFVYAKNFEHTSLHYIFMF